MLALVTACRTSWSLRHILDSTSILRKTSSSAAPATTCKRPRSAPTSSRVWSSRRTTSTRSSTSSVPRATTPKRARLIERFGLSEVQARPFWICACAALTGLDREKLETELAELREKIAYYKRILGDESLVKEIIRRRCSRSSAICRQAASYRKTAGRGGPRHRGPHRRGGHGRHHDASGYIKRLPVSNTASRSAAARA